MKNLKFSSLILILLTSSIFVTGCLTNKNQEPTIQELISQGRSEEAKGRFISKYDINAVDADGNTALHIAAQINNANLCFFLINNGADVNQKNYNNQSPLHVAIANDSKESASILVNAGCNIFSRDSQGKTAMESGFMLNDNYYDIFINKTTSQYRDEITGQTIVHYFVMSKNDKAINYCIKNGIPLSIEDNEGKTPLDYAFEEIEEANVVNIAANLIMNGAERYGSGNYDYFQTAVLNRNLDYRFDDGQTPLHLAAIQGHTAITDYLLKNQAQTDVQDSSGATPLHEAVRYGNVAIAKLLLATGANVNAKDNLGKTPILLAIPEEANKDIYSTLISGHADVSMKDTYGDTVLHIATMTGADTFVLETLVRAGADVNTRNKDGIAPLALAIDIGNAEHIQFYADHGADINSKDTKGNTPLTLALKKNDKTLEVILNKKNIDCHDSNGNTPLIVSIINDASLSKIQYILSLTDDVNTRNSEGNTALYLTVLKNRRQLGELLIAKKADIFATNTKNQSPLSLALNGGNNLMDWLITPMTVKQTDGSGNTALHYAAEWELKDAIPFLINRGADREAKNANGETAVFSAAKTNNPSIIDQLVACQSKINVRDNLGSTPLHVAVRWGNTNTAKKLLSLGIDINAQNVSGKSPLAEAALASKVDMARLLLANGANANSSDTSGRTIIMDAIRTQNTQIVKLLLANKANPNIQDINGRNSYHEAALTGNIEIIDLIRNAGGNPLSRDKNGITPFTLSLTQSNAIITAVLGSETAISDSDGNTPYHIIIKNKNSKSLGLIKTLIANGYPINTRNSDGYTPVSIAIENRDRDIAEILLKNGADPFITIDKKGKNAVIIALENDSNLIIEDIVKYAGTKTDIQGNTILHYAAIHSNANTVRRLVSYGLDLNVTNISGETPSQTAKRWKRNDIAKILTAE